MRLLIHAFTNNSGGLLFFIFYRHIHPMYESDSVQTDNSSLDLSESEAKKGIKSLRINVLYDELMKENQLLRAQFEEAVSLTTQMEELHKQNSSLLSQVNQLKAEKVDLLHRLDILVQKDKEAALKAGLYQVIGSEIDDKYMEELKKQIIHPEVIQEMADHIRIVYTPLCGTGNVPVRRILSELGFRHVFVVPEQEKPDPDFTTLDYPNPEDPKAFTYALRLAKEKDADIVLFLYRPDYYSGELDEDKRSQIDESATELIVAKNRHGATGVVEMAFDKEFTRFRCVEKDYGNDEQDKRYSK